MMEKFLSSHYNFRINLLRQTTEYAEAGFLDFRPLDSLALNTVYWHLRREKIPVRFHELECYLYSGFLPQYHPFRAYMDALPAWDGRDRLTPLARHNAATRTNRASSYYADGPAPTAALPSVALPQAIHRRAFSPLLCRRAMVAV